MWHMCNINLVSFSVELLIDKFLSLRDPGRKFMTVFL